MATNQIAHWTQPWLPMRSHTVNITITNWLPIRSHNEQRFNHKWNFLKGSTITEHFISLHQLVNATISSVNHVAATKCMKAYRHGQEVQLFFRPNVWMGKKCERSYFDHGIIVGARQGDLNISEIAYLLGFSCTTVFQMYREWWKKQKTSSEKQFCRKNRLFNDRGQRRRARVVKADRKLKMKTLQQWYF